MTFIILYDQYPHTIYWVDAFICLLIDEKWQYQQHFYAQNRPKHTLQISPTKKKRIPPKQITVLGVVCQFLIHQCTPQARLPAPYFTLTPPPPPHPHHKRINIACVPVPFLVVKNFLPVPDLQREDTWSCRGDHPMQWTIVMMRERERGELRSVIGVEKTRTKWHHSMDCKRRTTQLTAHTPKARVPRVVAAAGPYLCRVALFVFDHHSSCSGCCKGDPVLTPSAP